MTVEDDMRDLVTNTKGIAAEMLSKTGEAQTQAQSLRSTADALKKAALKAAMTSSETYTDYVKSMSKSLPAIQRSMSTFLHVQTEFDQFDVRRLRLKMKELRGNVAKSDLLDAQKTSLNAQLGQLESLVDAVLNAASANTQICTLASVMVTQALNAVSNAALEAALFANANGIKGDDAKRLIVFVSKGLDQFAQASMNLQTVWNKCMVDEIATDLEEATANAKRQLT